MQLSQALLTRVLSLSFLRRFVDGLPISALSFGEAVTTDSPLSAIMSEAEKECPEVCNEAGESFREDGKEGKRLRILVRNISQNVRGAG